MLQHCNIQDLNAPSSADQHIPLMLLMCNSVTLFVSLSPSGDASPSSLSTVISVVIVTQFLLVDFIFRVV